jgi:competence protein CoiA
MIAEVVHTKNNDPVAASSFTPDEWDALKASYEIGDLLMNCGCAAIPKTSPNGRHFFAHYAGECGSALETQWHLDAKVLVHLHLSRMGIECRLERSGASDGSGWEADVFSSHKGRDIVIELQHSYQTLARYRARQKRYEEGGVSCYWLLYPPAYGTLTASMRKWRVRTEFNNVFPAGGLLPCVADIPIATLETEPDILVSGAGPLRASLDEWLTGILFGRFMWDSGRWLLSPAPTA